MKRLCLVVSVLLALLAAPAVASILVQNEAATIISGDLLVIGGIPFYLRDVDSFELGQNCWLARREAGDCGLKAKEALQGVVGGLAVSCMAPGGTRYGSVVARCISGKGVDIGEEMVRRGWALVRPDLAGKDAKRLCKIEAAAKKLQRGAWKYEFAIPYLYRGEGTKTADEVSCGNHPVWP